MWQERLQKSVPVWMLIVVAVGVLALFGIGSGLYNSGWSDGLSFGLLAGSDDGAKLLTTPGYGIVGHGYHYGWGHRGFFAGFFGGFFRFVFFLFFLGLIFKLLGFWRWKMHHGWHNGHHSGHQGGHHGWHGNHQQSNPWQQPKPEAPAAPGGHAAEQPQPAKPVSFV